MRSMGSMGSAQDMKYATVLAGIAAPEVAPEVAEPVAAPAGR